MPTAPLWLYPGRDAEGKTTVPENCVSHHLNLEDPDVFLDVILVWCCDPCLPPGSKQTSVLPMDGCVLNALRAGPGDSLPCC